MSEPIDTAAMLADAEQAEALDAAMPPGRWVHTRYRNENGWWSSLVQERNDAPRIDSVITLLVSPVANQEKVGDVVEFCVRARTLLPVFAAHVKALVAENERLRKALEGILDMADDELRRLGAVPGSNVAQIEADARAALLAPEGGK